MIIFDEEKQNKQLDELHKEEEENLIEALASSKYKLPYVNLYRIGIDNEALRLIPEAEAIKNNIAPFKLSGKNVFIAVKIPDEDLFTKITSDMKEKNFIPTFYMVSSASLKKVWDR